MAGLNFHALKQDKCSYIKNDWQLWNARSGKDPRALSYHDLHRHRELITKMCSNFLKKSFQLSSYCCNIARETKTENILLKDIAPKHKLFKLSTLYKTQSIPIWWKILWRLHLMSHENQGARMRTKHTCWTAIISI